MCAIQPETVRLWLVFYGHSNFYMFMSFWLQPFQDGQKIGAISKHTLRFDPSNAETTATLRIIQLMFYQLMFYSGNNHYLRYHHRSMCQSYAQKHSSRQDEHVPCHARSVHSNEETNTEIY